MHAKMHSQYEDESTIYYLTYTECKFVASKHTNENDCS